MNPAKADTGERLVMAGPFQLRDLLGSGGFGEVWYGVREEPFFQEVAVKIPRRDRRGEDALQRFEAERQAMALVNHPNVIRFFEGGILESGDPYYAMEFVDGMSITEFCDAQAMSINERIALFVEACDGVAFVHELGILHRDIKPANLIVDEASGDPTVKLIDFGIARCDGFDEMGLVVGQTLDGALLGTRDYSSPEQIDGKHSELDESSDVFSLGAVLCELLCSVKPLDDDTLSKSSISEIVNRLTDGDLIHPGKRFSDLDAEAKEAAAQNRGGDAIWLAKILDGDLGAIVAQAIAADPGSRYETASDLASDLRRFLAGEPVEATALAKFSGAGRSSLKRNLFLTTAALAAGLMAFFGWGFPESGNPEKSEPIVAAKAPISVSEKLKIEEVIHQCRERIARAIIYWDQDQTGAAITDLKSVMADVVEGRLDHVNGRYVMQRRKIHCQVCNMLTYCLLQTGQVNEAQALLDEYIPHSRERAKFHSEHEGWIVGLWDSSYAALITLQGDAERFRGKPDEAASLYAEAIRIIERLEADLSNNKMTGVRGWGGHIGLPHGRLADLMVRPDSLVVSTKKRREWMAIAEEGRSPMELYQAERKILERFIGSQGTVVKKVIAQSYLKEARPWVDLGDLAKAKRCLQQAAEILENQNPEADWQQDSSSSNLLGSIYELSEEPDYTLNRVQSQLVETERWFLQGVNFLEEEKFDSANGSFSAAQAVADRLAKNCPEAPELLHYSAQVKLRIAEELTGVPNREAHVTELRNLASAALMSLKKVDAENHAWNQTLRYVYND